MSDSSVFRATLVLECPLLEHRGHAIELQGEASHLILVRMDQLEPEVTHADPVERFIESREGSVEATLQEQRERPERDDAA